MKVTVYAELAEDIRKKLNRLAKKAAGYGIPFSYTESDEIPAVVRVMGVDPARPSVLYEVSRWREAETPSGASPGAALPGLMMAGQKSSGSI